MELVSKTDTDIVFRYKDGIKSVDIRSHGVNSGYYNDKSLPYCAFNNTRNYTGVVGENNSSWSPVGIDSTAYLEVKFLNCYVKPVSYRIFQGFRQTTTKCYLTEWTLAGCASGEDEDSSAVLSHVSGMTVNNMCVMLDYELSVDTDKRFTCFRLRNFKSVQSIFIHQLEIWGYLCH